MIFQSIYDKISCFFVCMYCNAKNMIHLIKRFNWITNSCIGKDPTTPSVMTHIFVVVIFLYTFL